MRIALISWESLGGPAWTEVAQLVSETALALSARGPEVHVFTGRGPGQSAEAELDGVRYHRCAHDPDADPYEETVNFGRAVLHRIGKVEPSGRFGVVHGFEWPAAGVLGELRREGGRVTVWSFVHPHRDWRPPLWLLAQPDSESRWSYSPDDFADRVIAPSSPARAEFLDRWSMPAERVEVVHPGVDPGWPGEPVDPARVKAGYGFDVLDPVLLFIGALTPKARPGLLLEAMPLVLDQHPKARVLFAGEGELAGFLADRARVLGIESAVRLPGELPASELAKLCRSCDVVCLPQRSQALHSPVLQAWSASKPVVITRSHSAAAFVWPEITGYLADESGEGLAAALLWMFSDFDRCRWMGENGRRAVEDAFGWPAIAAHLLDCYRRAAAEGRLSTALDLPTGGRA